MAPDPAGEDDRDQPTHEVSWAFGALEDVDAIARFISRDKPAAALRFRARLVARADSLAWRPQRGIRVRGRLYKLLAHAPYVIRYVVDPGEVTIVSVRREAGQPPR